MEAPVEYAWKIGLKKAAVVAGGAAATLVTTFLASTRTSDALAWLQTIGLRVEIQVEDPDKLAAWVSGTVLVLGAGAWELSRNRRKVMRQIAARAASGSSLSSVSEKAEGTAL